MPSPTRRAVGAILAASTTLLTVTALSLAAPASPALAADTATINGATTYQTMTGFGASEAFGEASTVMNASSAVQQQALSLLYSPTVRRRADHPAQRDQRRLGQHHRAELAGQPDRHPVLPAAVLHRPGRRASCGSPSRSRRDYGVSNVFADAWTAPAFMKTNDSTDNGGAVCGTPGATCSSGDWRQAYANYLVQYAKDYAAAGVPLTYLGPENEANLSTSYDSMQLSPSQTANFLDVLGPTLASSGLSTKMECCATEGWDYAQQYAAAIEADSTASADTAVFTSHGYTAAPTSPLSGWSKPAWETEWSTFESWDPAWDDGTDASGLTWAQHIYQGLTGGQPERVPVLVGLDHAVGERGQRGPDPDQRLHGHRLRAAVGVRQLQPVRPPGRGPDRRHQLEQRGGPGRVQEHRRHGRGRRAEHGTRPPTRSPTRCPGPARRTAPPSPRT